MNKKIISAFLAAALITATLLSSGCGSVTQVTSEESVSEQSSDSQQTVTTVDYDYGLAENIEDGVILHAWSWSFSTITESMADIAAAGYSSIQTSPINACVVGGNGGMQLMGDGKWYYQYQPTDWTIGNYQLGTEEEFKEMCEEAEKYGIKIIVDVAPNHTTSTTDEVSESLLNAVGGFDELYHSNGFTEISDYTDRTECTTMSVGGVPDVDTENTGFQDYFIEFLNQCIADGADGFRYDTAKHIGLPDDPQDDESEENNFWERVTTEITNADSIFNYGEVLQDGGERIADYIETIGATTASSYGEVIRSSISSGILNAEKLSDFNVGGSTSVVTWVESHDNYTDGSSSSLTDEQLIIGWAIIAAQGDGTPLFFDRPYGSDSDNMWGSMNRIGAAGSTLYKDSTVVAVNRFRNAMIGESTSITNVTDSKSAIIIERGSKGAVLINAKSDDITVEMSTSLADGTYVDRANGSETFTVSNGTITGTLPGNSVIVLYNEGYTEPVTMASVDVDVDSFTVSGTTVEITLKCENAASSSYTINSFSDDYYASSTPTNLIECYTPEETVGFSDGDKITLDLSTGDSITLSATNSEGMTSNMTYYFTQSSTVSAGSEIYFEKPSSWSDEIYVYIYNESSSTTITNAEWPGELMTQSSDGTYSYTLNEDWTSGLVIFSDSDGNQYPAAMEPGESLEAGFTYTSGDSASSDTGTADDESSEDAEATSGNATITFVKPSSWGDTIYAYVYENGGGDKNAEWPGEEMTDNGDGTYSYEVSSSINNPVVIFTDGSNQYPSANSAGLDVTDGKTYESDTASAASSGNATVTFTKPSSWGDTIYAYVYESGGSGKNAAWPGEEMTDNGDGTYSYEVSSDINNPLIIFTDGSNQYPGANEAGLDVTDGKSYSAE